MRRKRSAAEEEARVSALYEYERQAIAEGFSLVAGVDEAGRGPLAGPVAASAVILPPECFIPRLNDSKKLSAKTRDELYDIIMDEAMAVSVALVDVETIDRINIYQATLKAMYEAVQNLSVKPDKVLTDAMRLEFLPMPTLPIVKGDAKSASIAAASIIAKVTRDRLMISLDEEYPEYGFARHKGYGTAEHIAAIKKHGPLSIHRRSFEPIRSMLTPEVSLYANGN